MSAPMRVRVAIGLCRDETDLWTTSKYAIRSLELPALPRKGEDVQLTSSGWSERVESVLWDLAGEHPVTAWLERTPLRSEYDELVAELRASGWEVHE